MDCMNVKLGDKVFIETMRVGVKGKMVDEVLRVTRTQLVMRIGLDHFERANGLEWDLCIGESLE